MSARVVSVRNALGQALHGVLEEPERGAQGAPLAAVLLSAGVKGRIGPHRLYRKLAPSFLRRGIPVLRLDFRGVGDSEGDWADERLEHIYNRVQHGECVDDARAGLDWLQSQCGIRDFIVGGLCGAAITGVHLASCDVRVAGVYAIGLPAKLNGAPSGEPGSMPRGMLRSKRTLYLRKLLRAESWLRFLTLRSDYRLMARLALDALRRRSFEGSPFAAPPAVPPPAAAPAADLDPNLPPAFFTMLKAAVPALLLYGETDPMRWDLEERFLQPWAGPLAQYAGLMDRAVVPGASHSLSDPADLAEAQRITGAWLDARFAQAIQAARPWPAPRSAMRAAA